MLQRLSTRHTGRKSYCKKNEPNGSVEYSVRGAAESADGPRRGDRRSDDPFCFSDFTPRLRVFITDFGVSREALSNGTLPVR